MNQKKKPPIVYHFQTRYIWNGLPHYSTFTFIIKKEEGISRLEKAIKQLKETDIHYLQILNSLFNFYYETENLDRFKEIENDLSVRVEQLSLTTIEELELAIKFNYNLGRYLWLQSKN